MRIHTMPGVFVCCVLLWWGALTRAGDPPKPEKIVDAATLKIVGEVRDETERLRGLKMQGDLRCHYLDSATLRALVETAFEKQFPGKTREAVTAFLASLRLVPEDLDLVAMYQGLLDEQVAGLYDHDSKALFVRRRMNLSDSPLARMILAHEICHALQDDAYGLAKMGIEAEDDDDRATAVLTVAEGDAMLLMSAYSLAHASADLMQDVAQVMSMDQSKFEQAPNFFKQQMLFPYIQGQAFMSEGIARGGAAWRVRVFSDPPRTTEQVMHPDKYFGERDEPSPVFLASGGEVPVELRRMGYDTPHPPVGYEKRDFNVLGELGVRLLFEERLGAGIASNAAAGWDGDAYTLFAGPDGGWWFAWESVWDTARDAREFADAFIVYWRAQVGRADLGKLGRPSSLFVAGDWTFHLCRAANRVAIEWTNRPTQ